MHQQSLKNTYEFHKICTLISTQGFDAILEKRQIYKRDKAFKISKNWNIYWLNFSQFIPVLITFFSPGFSFRISEAAKYKEF